MNRVTDLHSCLRHMVVCHVYLMGVIEIKKKIYIFLFIFILILSLYFSGYIVVITVPIFKGDAARITSISMDYIGRPVQVATGFDKKGVKKYYFVNQIHLFHPHLEYTVEANKGITKD